MITRARNWIVRKTAHGGFSRRRDVFLFVFNRTILTTLVAVALNCVASQLFGRLGIFPIPNALADAVVTACVAAPISFLGYYILGAAIQDLAISRNEFERLSRTDPLTGLTNRRGFVEVLAALDEPYVLALFDIDRFKMINDTHGHGAGDKVLIGVSRMLRDVFAESNAVARLGGEEFGVVLKLAGKHEAMTEVDAFRATLAAHVFEVGGVEFRVTASAGVSQGNGNVPYPTLLTKADEALYLAKASGRNRVVHSDDIGVLPQNCESSSSHRAG